MKAEHHIRARSSDDASATPVELFFDLVFVFALIQVTGLMAADLTVHGLTRGVLIMALLWWSWVGYAWLSNTIQVTTSAARILMFIAMGSMFLLAITIPESFDDLEGGLNGPVVVALCYLFFRFLHLALYWISSRDDPGLRKQLVRFTPSVIGGTTVLLIASGLDGTAQTIAWGVALLADYAGTFFAGSAGWRIKSVSHFAERHALILIVALGESIVAIGFGMAAEPISWPIFAASGLGLALSTTLWWAYFHSIAVRGERALEGASEEVLPRMGRDAYTFLHFPMILGIVLMALGMKKVLEYVSDREAHALSDALPTIAVGALYFGIALYLLAQVAFMINTTKEVDRLRAVVAGVILLLIPLAAHLPALAALALVTTVVIALIVTETLLYEPDLLDESAAA